MIQGLKSIRSVTWQEVFAVWKTHEGADPVWQEFARREKGWETWEQWRSYQAAHFDAAEREWMLYEIEQPDEIVPAFRMGPFHGWQKRYEEKNVHTFQELVRDHHDWVASNSGVQSRMRQFPRRTQFIGMYLENEDVVVLYEGHHRAAAIALAVAQRKPIVFETNPTIALTTIRGNAQALLDRLLKEKNENPL